MGRDDDSSALAWLWVIEALSTSKDISISTLKGLIDAAPVRHDEFSEKTKELIAMRCLEKLSTYVVDPATSSTQDSRVGFDCFQSCEGVLQEILDENKLSKLKKSGAELLKLDAYPFIKNKRAGSFKCHLEQLRESILDGTHPHTDYLKERSGLFPQNSSYTVRVDDRKRDDHSAKDAGNSTYAETKGQKKNPVSSISENGNKSSKEHLLDNNFSPSKRSRVYSADDHLTRHLHEKQVCKNDCDDFFRNSKRIKCYASTSFESEKEKTDSHLRQEVSEHLTERILISEHGEHHAEKNNKETLGDGSSIAEPFNNASMDETDDTAHHVIPTNVANAEKNQHMINLHQPKQREPDITFLNFTQKPVASDKTIVDMVNGCGADGYHDGKNNLEAKEHEFLHSPSPVYQDFLTMTESTEQIVCMKCNEGGQLLACKTTTCPLMMHKNCLGESAQLDAEGIFLCPLCAYSHAISEYIESKKKVSLARKELDIFISKGMQNQAAGFVHEFDRQERCFSRKSSESEHIHVENDKDDLLTGCEDNRIDHVGEHANEANNLQFERSQQEAPISCREKENVNNGPVEVVREKEINEIPKAKSLIGGRVEENEVPPDGVDDGHFGETNLVTVNQNNAGEEVPQEMTRQNNIDETIEPACAHDTGKGEISDDECEKHSTPRYSMRHRKHETQYKPQASPVFPYHQLRRKNIPWTAEEEELLREGVQKFGFDDRKKWKKILAFGSHVFEKVGKRRTPQDLKDKWKNMCKARSKSK